MTGGDTLRSSAAACAAALLLPLAAGAQTPSGAPLKITRHGTQDAVPGSGDNFTGAVRVDFTFKGDAPARIGGGHVSFDRGARTAWHTHPLGQTLIVDSGVGLVQRWGGPVQEIRVGDVVWIPPGEKHWHGASAGSAMSHFAITEQLDGKTVDWLEKVSDAQYPSAAAADKPQAPSRAQVLMGATNPKLAELTDKVLYDDVWKRPGLAARDRSLATVAALIAMNRPDQLRSHLALARTNGVSEAELIELITQMAFYAGWPSAVTATAVAKEVFEKK